MTKYISANPDEADQGGGGEGVTDHGALTGLADDDHSQYHNTARANTWLATKTTDNLTESATNKYATEANIGAIATAAASKTTPVDGDTFPLNDSAASNALKKVSWSNIKATLKSYFDTLYQPLASVLTNTTASFTTALETKLNGVEANADVTDAANVDSAGATMNADTTLAGNGYFLDEDDMVSNSATKVPSQQSTKAYVDAQIIGSGSGDVVGPASSVVSEVALFDGTTGKLIKRATGTGIAKLTSGVLSAGTIATAEIDPGAVTWDKIQDISTTDRLLGRDTAAGGDIEELTVGGGLEFTGSGGIRIADGGVASEKLQATIAFSARRATAQSVTGGALAKVQLPTEDYDTGSDFDSATNYRFVAPVAGIYHFDGQAIYSAAPERIFVSLYKNGAEFLRGGDVETSVASGARTGTVSCDIQLAATDYVELWAFCDDTADVNPAKLTGHFVGS